MRKRWDFSNPETGALREHIVHGHFLAEGNMVAFPLCFPGVTTPIPRDESRITTLAVTANRMIYGGTTGHQAHLFVAMFHGATGTVLDLGVPQDAVETAAVCCTANALTAAVNTPREGRLVKRRYQNLPFDLLQEWSFPMSAIEDVPGSTFSSRILDLVMEPTGQVAIGLTQHELFAYSAEANAVSAKHELPGRSRIILLNGNAYGLDEANHLWCYSIEENRLQRRAIALPEGTWEGGPVCLASDRQRGIIYIFDTQGRLFSYSEQAGFSALLGQTPLQPVTTAAITIDGRLFGCAGDTLQRFFVYEPLRAILKDLGVAISVMERRRYGFEFASSAVGQDGQVFFGENDDLAHLWIYFPRLLGSD